MNILKTKYPIILLTGFNNCDQMLEIDAFKGIADVFSMHNTFSFGYTDAFGLVDHNARQAEVTIRRILKETGAEKVHLFGISRGGFDARRTASLLGQELIASVTEIGMPHRGAPAMEMMLNGTPESEALFTQMVQLQQLYIAQYNNEPADMKEVVATGTAAYAEGFMRENPDVDGIFYRSVGLVMKNADSDPALSDAWTMLQKMYGDNDGVVPLYSAVWTNFRAVHSCSDIGISHYQLGEVNMKLTDENGNGEYETLGDMYHALINELAERGM